MDRSQCEAERREAKKALASAPRFRFPDPWIESEYVEAGHLRAALAREAELEELLRKEREDFAGAWEDLQQRLCERPNYAAK